MSYILLPEGYDYYEYIFNSYNYLEVVLILNLQDIQNAQRYGIIQDEDAIKTQIIVMQRRKILEQHEGCSKIWQGESNGYWYTYLPPNTTHKIKKRKREDLEQAIVDYYKKTERAETPYFRSVYDEWKQNAGVTVETIKRYDSDLNRFFPADHPFCKIPISSITYDDLDSFIREAITEHNLTAKAYGNMRTILTHVFKKAWNKRYTDLNIREFLDNIDLPYSIFASTGKNKDDAYTNEERVKIYRYCMLNPTPKKLAVALLCIGGFRVGEVASFKPEDNVEKNYLLVHRRQGLDVDANGSYHVTVKDHAKQGHDRKVFIGTQGQQIINMAKLQKGDHEFLFYSGNRRVSGKMITYELEKICKELNIRYRSPHKIRKTCISHLLDKNVPESLVQNQAGHKQITTTQLHYHKNIYSSENQESILEHAMSI